MNSDAGRKRKFGNKRLSERVVFYVTEEQKEELEKKSDGDASSFVRQAVIDAMSVSYLEHKNLMRAVNDPNDPSGQTINREIDTNPEIQALAKKYAQYTLTFPVAQPTYERFAVIASSVGYADPNQLAKDLVMVSATKGEAETREFIFGEIQKEAMKAAQEREVEIEEENAKPVKLRKSA